MAMIKNGKAYWAKITKAPVINKFTNRRQWSLDVALDKTTVQQLTKAGLGKKIKNVGDDRGDFITFKREEFKNDEAKTPNQPIKIYNHHGDAWDGHLIGNGSTVNVTYNVYQTKAIPPGLNVAILSVQVWDLVEYVGKSEFPVRDESVKTVNKKVKPAEDWQDDESSTD